MICRGVKMNKTRIKTLLIALGIVLVIVLVVGINIVLRNSSAEIEINEAYEEPSISDEEVLARMRRNYGEDVELIDSNDTYYTFVKKLKVPIEGKLVFYAEVDNEQISDNYYDELYRYTGDAYYAQSGRTLTWDEQGEGAKKSYRPIFAVPGRNDDELRWFCEDVCQFLEYCYAVEPLKQEAKFTESFLLTRWSVQTEFRPTAIAANYDRIALNNELYLFADAFLMEEMQKQTSETTDIQDTPDTQQPDTQTDMQATIDSVDQEIIELYLSYEPECTYTAEDGMEYRMLPVDRATGSSYYVLLGMYDNGATCSFLNLDPYNGSGGESKWIDFLDEKLGFSCLAYSGGAYGSLYRTEDGGKTFANIEYPSAQRFLPDGTYYNPYVMPEQIYEEDGKLYMVVGQGPNGDYYGEDGKRNALYASEDTGKTWQFIEEID